jgi:hypothetical protein
MTDEELVEELKINREMLFESQMDFFTRTEQKILKEIHEKSIGILNSEIKKRNSLDQESGFDRIYKK